MSDPLATPDGAIVVARQKYAESHASLMVYRLHEVVAQQTPTPKEPPPSPSTEPVALGSDPDSGLGP
jgi:hypothetical protein